jgi:glycosyltransferase involved in cell wall biosynthesis
VQIFSQFSLRPAFWGPLFWGRVWRPRLPDGQVSNFKINSNHQISKIEGSDSTFPIPHSPFFLFIGRVEERKNVGRIIAAFEIFKQKTGLPHKLVLAGKPGYGYQKIKEQISKNKYQEDLVELGYISEEEKWELLSKAEALRALAYRSLRRRW